jgi:hypothetical protein
MDENGIESSEKGSVFACESENDALSECLGKYQRDWTKCQEYVQKLKDCMKDSQQSKK